MRSATSLLAFALACSPTSRPGRLGEQIGAALDRLLLGAHGERRHPPTLQGEDATLADHLAGHRKRLLGTQLARLSAPARPRAAAPPRTRPRARSASLRCDPRSAARGTLAAGRRPDAPPHPPRTRDAPPSAPTRAAGRHGSPGPSRGGSRARCRGSRRVRAHGRAWRGSAPLPGRSHGGGWRTRRAARPAPPRSRSTCRPCRCPARSGSPPLPAPARAPSGRTRRPRAPRNTGREATATMRSSSRTAPVITTWVCSCGSGASAPLTPLAVVWR